MRSFKKKLLKDRKSGRRLRVGKLAPSFSGILYDRTFFDTVESFKDNANILVKKQGLPFMFNHFFFENFLCKSSLCSTTFILQRVLMNNCSCFLRRISRSIESLVNRVSPPIEFRMDFGN